MDYGKLYKFKIAGYDATLLNQRVEVSVPNYDDSTKIVLRLSNSILDKKIKSLRINLPDKIIFISSNDNNHLLMRAEDFDNKKIMN